MLKMKNLVVKYDDIIALDHINLTFDKKCIAIIGENGSGKSTLLTTILGLNDYQGDILFHDQIIQKNNLSKIRKDIGLVFQNPDHQLFMATVLEDLRFGLVNQKKDETLIQQRIDKYSQLLSIEDLLTRPSSQLSGGQKRLVALATVLVMEPEILMFDEPSSYLDPKSRRRIINIIKNLSQNIIFTTHDLDLALDVCDEVILLNHGQVIAQGSPKEILTNEQLLLDHAMELPLSYQRRTI